MNAALSLPEQAALRAGMDAARKPTLPSAWPGLLGNEDREDAFAAAVTARATEIAHSTPALIIEFLAEFTDDETVISEAEQDRAALRLHDGRHVPMRMLVVLQWNGSSVVQSLARLALREQFEKKMAGRIKGLEDIARAQLLRERQADADDAAIDRAPA